MVRIEAQVTDDQQLLLKSPVPLRAGSRVILEIHPIPGDEEHRFWSAASASLLERGYGPDEPDYSNAGSPL